MTMTIKETIDRCREILAQRTDLISPAGVVGSTPAMSIGDMAEIYNALPSLLDRLNTAERLLGELADKLEEVEPHDRPYNTSMLVDDARTFLAAKE